MEKKSKLDKIQEQSERKIRISILANRIPHPFNNKFLKDMTLDDKIAIANNSIKQFINDREKQLVQEWFDLINSLDLDNDTITKIMYELYPLCKEQFEYLSNIIKKKHD